MDFTFKVEGLRELDRELKRLSTRGAKNAKRAAIRKGAQHLRKQIKSQLPRTVGKKIRVYRSNQVKAKGTTENVHLRNRIGIQVKRSGDVDIGYVGLARAYGHIIEFGVSYGKALRSTGNGVWERTFGTQSQRVIDLTGTALGESIIKEIGRGR